MFCASCIVFVVLVCSYNDQRLSDVDFDVWFWIFFLGLLKSNQDIQVTCSWLPKDGSNKSITSDYLLMDNSEQNPQLIIKLKTRPWLVEVTYYFWARSNRSKLKDLDSTIQVRSPTYIQKVQTKNSDVEIKVDGKVSNPTIALPPFMLIVECSDYDYKRTPKKLHYYF